MAVGALLLLALAVFGLGTFYLQNWQYKLGKGYRLMARFPMAATLDKGDLVRLAGVPVGIVSSLHVATEGADPEPVEVQLWIRRGVKVHDQDEAIIRVGSLFGGNYVAIERSPEPGRELADGDEIPNTSVAPTITQAIEASTRTLDSISSAFENIEGLIEQVSEGEGTLAKLISDEEMFGKLENIVDDAETASAALRTASEKLQDGEGVLGKLFMDDELAAKLDATVADASEIADSLKSISADLRDGRGTIGKLLASEEIYNKVDSSLGTFDEVAALVRDGEGLVSRLLSDEQLANDVQATAGNLRQVSDDLRDGEGTIGKLLASDEAYEKLNASLDDLNEVTAGIAAGEGTLGKLLKDETVYAQLTQVLGDVQGLLRTYREQSPVISFAGAVFGAF
jgi:phospholipid/cholesterol/gamma-HCH transport system substrate-binding protein